MAAGLGFKDFTTGEVLTAADVDGYLMQGVWVFASAAARDAAVTSPQEGNFAYLKDTNVTTYYTGSAWANLDTTGMTNPMTTTGDTIYSSSGSTPARLGIGIAGQVLQVNSGATAPEWATPAAGGGITLISETVASALSSLSLSSIPSTYKHLVLTWHGIVPSANDSAFGIRFNNNSTANTYKGKVLPGGSTPSGMDSDNSTNAANTNAYPFGATTNTTTTSLQSNACGVLIIYNYASSTKLKVYEMQFYHNDISADQKWYNVLGTFNDTTAISSIDIYRSAGSATFTNATNTSIRLYGVS
jgi:hypothetical protein